MFNVCLIDDEADARALLRGMLYDFAPDCRIIGEASSKAEAIHLLSTTQPDAIFLDIDLKDGTGFEVLAALPPPQYAIVFETAFNDFALKAFQVNALDYLLKPIEANDIKRALQKIRQHQPSTDLPKQIANLLTTVQTRRIEKIVLHTADGLHFVPIEKLLHLEARGAYTAIRTLKAEKIMVSQNLGHFDYLCTEGGSFLRTHQSHIIRMSAVSQFLTSGDGEYAVLDNGEKIPVARRRRDAFLAAMTG